MKKAISEMSKVGGEISHQVSQMSKQQSQTKKPPVSPTKKPVIILDLLKETPSPLISSEQEELRDPNLDLRYQKMSIGEIQSSDECIEDRTETDD